MQLGGAGRLFRTVRHLKPIQVAARAAFRVRRPRPRIEPAPPLRARPGAWVTPARREPTLTAPATFDFLGQSHRLEDVGWDGAALEKLWRYNQHYFDDLTAAGGPERAHAHAALIADWIERNPPGIGVGWEPYPTSVRIVNWVKWANAGADLGPRAIHSLAIQLRWLRRRIEWHLLGNHLFVNAKALVFGGLFFRGGEAQEWLRFGVSILERQLPEQVLADGGQFERSPMYHALALEDVLDLVQVIRASDDRGDGTCEALLRMLTQRVDPMRRWLRAACHPDGQVAFFNDAAMGIAPAPGEIERYARALGFGPLEPQAAIEHLVQSGYVCLRRDALYAMLDVAPVGPDYLPGHAHADTLSFELSVGRQRVVVNGGTSCYGTGPVRLAERGTAAHSTVQVAGLDSSEVWSGFRVGRRARPVDVRVAASDDGVRVEAAHDGYAHLPGVPLHRRAWQVRDGSITVSDEVTADAHDAVARFHLHPEVVPEVVGDAWRLGPVSMKVHEGRVRVAPSHWSPRFGQRIASRCMEVSLVRGRSVVSFEWGSD